jgi:sugar phosphate isomerase/epimerase
MKLCFSTLACPQWTLPQILEACSENGIEGVDFRGLGAEIDLTRHIAFTMELEATLEEFRRRKLSMPCLNTSVTLVSPSPERWAAMLEECHRYAELAGKTGTKWIRIFGGAAATGMTRDEALMMAQRHLRQLVKICKPFGCTVAIETHDDFIRSDDMLALLHEFDPADVAVLWDMEHTFRAGEALEDSAQSLRRYLRHVHLKDSDRVDGKNVPKLMGEGNLPIARFIDVLRGVEYDGWLCLETEKRWHAGAPEPELSIPQFGRFMGELLGRNRR